MKYFLIALLFVQFSFSQKLSKEKLLDKMANEICDEFKTKKVTPKNFEMTLGLLLIKSVNNNKENVNRYYGSDMYGKNGIIEKIGEDLGMSMLNICPEVFEKMNDMGVLEKYADDELESENDSDTLVDSATMVEEEEENLSISGTFLGSKAESFYTIEVKESNGKINKLVLLDKIDNSYLITDNVIKTNDKVKFEYYELEIFDPKLKMFVKNKIILDIIKL